MKVKLTNKLLIQTKASSFQLKKSLLFVCFFVASIATIYAQSKTITGKIQDNFNDPLPGVSIRIQGTTVGTMTDIDGLYSISAKTGDVLEFTYIGMKAEKIKVGDQTTINLTMEDDAKMLAETVVIGYGTAKKVDLTGSIGSVNSETILKQPSSNAIQAVQGKIAGVNIMKSDEPGANPSVVIRGMGTALGGRMPLYIVDGFPVSDIKNISASDILTMDVMKDAASASIYGVRAANGVILITTKKGQEGTTKIGVDSYVGIKNVLKKVKMANASQYIEFFNENQDMLKVYDTSWDQVKEPNKYFHLADASLQANNIDWYDELLETGIFTNNTVSLSGGSKVVDYFFSYNLYDEKGILDGQSYNRSTLRNNNVFKFFNDKLKIKQNLSLSITNEKPKTYGAFNEAYRQTPLTPIKYADGRYGRSYVDKVTGLVGYDPTNKNEGGELNSIANPLFSIADQNQKVGTFTAQGGLEAEYTATDWMSLSSRIGGTKYYLKDRQFKDVRRAWFNLNPARTEAQYQADKAKSPQSVDYANNWYQISEIQTFRWTWESFATFNKTFDKHRAELVVGFSMEKEDASSSSFSKTKVYNVPEKEQYWSVNHASGEYPGTLEQYYYTPRSLASFFARLQYNYDSKYYLSATVRRDGSSTFVSNNDYWGTFPSIGLGWTISREDFMKDVTFFDHLKLKATWGKLGNQNVDRNVSKILTKRASEDYNYVLGRDQAFIHGAAFGTPALPISWEVTRETGVGLDFAVLGQRLTGSIDYYDKLNTNAILEIKPMLNSVWEKEFFDHGAKIRNNGVEFALGWNDELANGISYQVSANYSHNTNKVKTVLKPEYNGDTGGSLADGQITKRLQEGEPVYAWWMYESQGIWQSQDEIDNNAHYGSPKPGHIRYKDQNDDGVIDDRDKVFMGSYIPTYTYGIQLGLAYKNIDFSIDGYGVGGNKIYNGLKYGRINGGENIAYDTYKDRWTALNPNNEHPGANREAIASDYYLESGAFFRINNITLGYTFNDLIYKGSRLRLYATAQNPFIFTKYSGFSPEINSSGDVARIAENTANTMGNPKETSGIELTAYPSTRNFVFGLNIQF